MAIPECGPYAHERVPLGEREIVSGSASVDYTRLWSKATICCFFSLIRRHSQIGTMDRADGLSD
jgi:hypothetical protein